MIMDWSVLPIMGVIFIATVIRSAFGFGEALVAVPLLALLIPVEVAAPLAVLVSITVAGVIVAQDWDQVHARSAWRLVVSTLFGIPLGLLLLEGVEEAVVKGILALVIISFSLFCLVRRSGLVLPDDRWAWVFGFGAGVLGGAYGMNGPPLVIYGALRRWSPGHFRATLQGYFLPASLAGMTGYWIRGFWRESVTCYYLWCLLPAVAAIFIGRAINRRLHGNRFIGYIYFGLIAVGTGLLVQALRG